MTLHDLAEKDVIRIQNGENLGRIDDILFDEGNGRIQSVLLRGRGRMLGLLGYDDDLLLPWESIRRIGADVVIVDADPLPTPRKRRV
ncbi:YlmC/YmxH family sporulation protein [uncultured Gemmiger sp.]|uniref:YlmC/YmxH family sporulation protein n=1 Tax=uncultured Gemmiger sp. TaxID=1623490 RepID=UPI0025D9A081|nr:YlmC/YmxH family sporulation protein [uncultured Gemmiger sp.]